MSSCDLVLPSLCMTQRSTISSFSDPSHSFSKKQKMMRFLGCPGALYWSKPAKRDWIVPWLKLTSWRPMDSNYSVSFWPGSGVDSWLKRLCINLANPQQIPRHLQRPPREIVFSLVDVTFPCYHYFSLYLSLSSFLLYSSLETSLDSFVLSTWLSMLAASYLNTSFWSSVFMDPSKLVESSLKETFWTLTSESSSRLL